MTKLTYSETEIDKIVELYISGLGSTRIARRMGKGKSSQVEYVLRLRQVKMRPAGRGRPVNSFPGVSNLRNFIDGLLLGDGCLFPVVGKHKNSGLIVNQRSDHKDFLSWIQDVLISEDIPSRIHPMSKRNAHSLYTPRSIEFTKLRERWYPDGKQVPKDIHLTPKSFIAWYLGDGTKHPSDAMQIYTNSFSFPDVEFLASCILRDFGIKATVYEHVPGENSWTKHPNRARPVIYIKASQARWLFGLLGPCPVKSQSYKWPDQFSLAFSLRS